MKIKFSVRGVLFEDDIVEKEVDVIDKYDYVFEKKLFADQIGVDYDRVQDDMDPVDYIDMFGVTFFGDRDDECPGDCDKCQYAYYETDHGYAYEESKLHCRLWEAKS